MGMAAYLKDIWSYRYFWLSLVKIDLRARYRRSVIGIGWSLLRPVVMTIVLCAVFRRLFRPADVWDYAPYLLTGLACWDYITTATKQGCQCFFQGESYIRQHPAPIAIYPLRIALGETVHFFFALLVVLGLAWYAKGGFGSLPALASLLPTLLLLFALVWALALIAGFANVYFQDTQHLCDVVFQIVFYATPIIYYEQDLGVGGRLHWLVTHCNPLVPFLDLMRDPILRGKVPSLDTYAAAAAALAAVGGVAAVLCARLERRIIFHL
jgi:ABC-type polysaccharide/polyol phosphate export permease